ncbi:MAG: carboxypeptidase regulatory-like domain-containing protein, partial [Candidatus Brocadiaceae bacterium]|jgi:peroxiredoxin
LRLKPAVAIGGLVRDEQGEPVQGAQVNVHLASSGPGPQDFFRGEDLPTDEKGRWRAQGAPADARRFSIHVSHPDYAAEPHYRPVDAEKLLSMEHVSVLESGCALRGRVTDAEGNPIADARVMLGADRFGLLREPSTNTDEEGRFAFDSVSPTVQTVTAYARGYAPDLRRVKVSAEAEPLTFRLDRGHTIRGRVVGPDGTPLEGAGVAADTWRDCRPNFWEARTDAEGRFEWNSAPPDAVLFHVYKQGYMSKRDLTLTAREEGYRIQMQRPLEVSGTVTDAETGEALPEFTVIPGIQWDAQRPTSWQREDAKRGMNGRYRVKFTYPRFGHAVRIEAEGYKPGVSRTFKDDEGRVSYDFELQKGAGIQGVVLRPDDQPAAGAECALVRAGQGIRVENGAIGRQSESPVVETGADGRFSFPDEVGEFAILVLHRSGYARVAGDELPADGRVHLSPWARVEGRAMRGDEPLAGVQVKLFARDGSPGSTSPYISWQYSTLADGEGRFTFSQVRAGEVQALLAVEKEHGRSAYTHHELAFVESGETAKVTLGGGGRPVVGRLGLPEDAGFAVEAVDVRARLGPTRPELPLPEGFEQWPEDKQREWYEQWRNSEEGRAFRKEHYGSYHVEAQPDGSFRGEDVPPGDYTLWITLQQPTRPGRRPEVLAQAKETFSLQEGSGAVDLGTVEAVPLTRLESGQRAPDISFETLKGERMRLSDFRGRHVLVDFWATWCGPCLGETPHLVEVWEEFGEREDFAMVGLSLDKGKDKPRAYAEEKGMEWVQGFLGDWSATNVPDRFGVRGIPAIFLIDPEGQIVARDLRGQRIKRAVETALPPRK